MIKILGEDGAHSQLEAQIAECFASRDTVFDAIVASRAQTVRGVLLKVRQLEREAEHGADANVSLLTKSIAEDLGRMAGGAA